MSIRNASLYRPSLSCWKYDVFLSFRGEDTRKNFIDHLHAALNQRGINVFKDDNRLEKGKSISPELSKAIEESRISIIVFSRNYASSTWCLNELVKIIQCMKIKKQMVIPIFYDVDPSIIRKQTKNFQEAFSKHEEAFRENIKKVQNWRNALNEAANLCGWDLKDRYEFEFVQDIVKDISRKLSPTTLQPLEGLVGVDSRVEKLRSLIGSNSNDVCMIGIYGMGGIGKTTIARAIYDLISCEFEGTTFLANVREVSGKVGLVHLQKQLLSQILWERDIHIWDVYDGIRMIRSRLWHKKVLIVVDDVDDMKQLNELIGKHEWFGLGSRIIIITRDKHLLVAHGVDKFYKVDELNIDEALQLFSLKAFKTYLPSKEFEGLSKRVVNYAYGLPLALQVLGSFLFSKSINEWESALERLGRDSEKGILDSLQISFDGLKETEKKIFLDIACFFKGKNKDHVTRILDGCGFSPIIGISVLVDKSLVTIDDDNILGMHDLLQKMGQQIVKKESKEEPGKCSRLWEEIDVCDVLTGNTGTEVVEGIILENELQYLSLTAKAFTKMTNLRLLKISNVQLPYGLDHLSNNLRLLEWHGYPLKFLPPSLQLKQIVELKMYYSQLEQLWRETKPLNKLKVISLIHSKNLTKTPDFTVVPNLEELVLERCMKLCEIHPSLLVHKKLILLNLRDCTSLTSLPRKMDMESLKILVLSGCSKLKKFPDSVQSTECLSELFLDGTPVKELPFPIELMKGIVLLSMENCKNLESLPSNINGLKFLRTLKLSGCSKLENVPENLGQVECLEKLDLSRTGIRKPVSSIFSMKNLKKLSFCGCKGTSSTSWYTWLPFSLMFKRNSNSMALMLPPLSSLYSLTKLDLSDCYLEEGAICNEIGNLTSLKELYLEKNNFVSIPASINHLSNLEYLSLNNCKRLQLLPELPSNLRVVTVDNCASLETFPNLLKSRWIHIGCTNCLKLLDCTNVVFSEPKEFMPNPTAKSNVTIPGSQVPKWFSHQSYGSTIKIKRHPKLKFKGFFVCIVVSPLKNKAICVDLFNLDCYAEQIRAFSLVVEPDGICLISDHICITYIPIWKIHRGPQKNWYLFEFRSCGHSEVSLRRFAAHPIYEEVDEFDHLTGQCSSSVSENSIEFHQEILETNVSTTKRSLADYDVGIGKEPQPKRSKKFEG